MKTPLFTRAGLLGTAIVAGLLLATVLAGCATVSTVTSTVPSAPPSSFGHVRGMEIDERSDAIHIATHGGLVTVTVTDSIGFPLNSASLSGLIAGLYQDNMGFAIDRERMYASGHPDPTVSSNADPGLVSSTDQGTSWSTVAPILAAAAQRGIVASSDLGAAWRNLETN